MSMDAVEELVIPDAAAWRTWLDEHEDESDGVWLVLAKKGTSEPTRLTYAEALEEALCSGWIDGRKQSRDAATFRQHFTPRRRRSIWSLRNVGLVGELIAAGRMRERGHTEIALAQEDGRWDRAYGGSAAIEVPEDLRDALEKSPAAASAFAALNRSERYSVLFAVTTAVEGPRREATIRAQVARLEASTGE